MMLADGTLARYRVDRAIGTVGEDGRACPFARSPPG